MSLAAGTRIGPYEIVAPLGAGGMGEVYRARDARLGRDVAVKALPAAGQDDEDRVERFAREAQVLASLSHPHIASLYGIEDAAGAGTSGTSRYLILELLEGGTLADRLRGGPLEVREAVTVARQVADALQAAHERGIIHRDLKPANIAFSAGGHAKVLDFGLAKVQAPAATDDTVAAGLTRSGVVVGTAAYMSPEQARGLPLDRRSDIWSFGCVLYEMLTGSHPFAAATLSDMVGRLLNEDPDWGALPGNTPARVHWVLRRCLEKDPRRRLHDVADARIELDDALAKAGDSSGTLDGVASATGSTTASVSLRRRERLAWAAALLVLVVFAAVLSQRAAPPSESGSDARAYVSSIVLPQHLHLSGIDPARFALSPDGRRLAFVAAEGSGPSMLWIRHLDSPLVQSVAGTDGAAHPFWSPDSTAIAFIARPPNEVLGGARGQLKRVDIARGGAPTFLTNLSFLSTGAWSSKGVILFTPSGNAPLHRVAASGGPSSAITTLNPAQGDVQHSYPYFLPDGEHFLYTVVGSQAGGATDVRAVYLGSLDASTPPRQLLERAADARYASGHLLFLRDRTLLAQPFDVDRLEPLGQAAPLAERLQVLAGGIASGVSGAFSVSNTGLLAFEMTGSIPTQLEWFDRSGTRLGTLGPPAEYADVVLAPGGTRVAVTINDPQMGTQDIWIYDVARGLRERFTSDPGEEFAPVWSPAGDGLAFSATRQGSVDMYRQRPGGTEEKLDRSAPGLGKFAASWSPDGQWILYIAGARIIARSDLMVLPLDGERKPEVFRDSQFIETQGRFSPDGRWIAYSAHMTGRLEVYVSPFPARGEPTRVSSNGGMWPHWRADGSELFFIDAENRLMSAAVNGRSNRFDVGDVRPLFTAPTRPMSRLDAYPYDVAPDGRRFLMVTSEERAPPVPQITFVVNWPALLRK